MPTRPASRKNSPHKTKHQKFYWLILHIALSKRENGWPPRGTENKMKGQSMALFAFSFVSHLITPGLTGLSIDDWTHKTAALSQDSTWWGQGPISHIPSCYWAWLVQTRKKTSLLDALRSFACKSFPGWCSMSFLVNLPTRKFAKTKGKNTDDSMYLELVPTSSVFYLATYYSSLFCITLCATLLACSRKVPQHSHG